ncbi:TonB-dependent receptor [Glaciecola sp. 1036]|uniref:TonB-dependent receptor n=1 Tax=Alteromonadaceae TaxID=72275 RepID=UPI003D08702F
MATFTRSSKINLVFTISLISLSLISARLANAQESEQSESQVEVIEVKGNASQVDLTKRFAGEQIARGGRAGIFGNLDFLDSPFAGTAYTADLIKQQQAQNIGDVLLNDPTVRVTKGFGNFQEVYILRGFPVYSDDITLNGAFGILPRQYVAAEMIERVEVLRGANAFVNGAAPGASGVGGSINLVPKRAPVGGIRNATLGYEESSIFSAAVDLGQRYGENDQWGVRFNSLTRGGESIIDGQEQDLSVLALNIDYAQDNLRFSADLGYQDNHIDAPRPQVTPLGDIPSAPDADVNFAQPWTFTDESQVFGVLRAEYDISDTTKTWIGAGFRKGEEENDLANPTADANGIGSAYRFANTREDEVYSVDAGVSHDYQLSDTKNTLIVSGAIIDLESKNAFAFSNFAGFATSIYQPTAITPPATDFFVGGDLASPLVTEKVRNQSVAIANTTAWQDETVLTTIGVRYQSIDTQSFNAAGGDLSGSYDDSKFTPVVGIVVKPSDQFSIYANYAESLTPGASAPDTANGLPVVNAGEVLAPFTGEQYEIGFKYDGGNIGSTASVFNLNRPNSVIENQIFSDGGEQQSQGVEFSVFGQPTQNSRLIAGGTYVVAELANTQSGIDEGNTPIGIPELQTNINFEYDVTDIEGLTLDARWIYTSEQYTNTANTIELDDWNRFDLGARYSFIWADTIVDIRGRINNLTDKAYWASTGGYPGANYLILGEPRTLSLSVSFDF